MYGCEGGLPPGPTPDLAATVGVTTKFSSTVGGEIPDANTREVRADARPKDPEEDFVARLPSAQ